MMKTKQDNDVIVCRSTIYAKNKIELLWLIRSGVVYDKN